MAGINWYSKQLTCDRMIRKFGMAAVLRRTVNSVVVDRACTAAVVDYNPMEARGKLLNPIDRVALISARGLSPAPDNEKDTLVTFVPQTDPTQAPVVDQILKLVEPPSRIGPADIPVYWEVKVRV